MLGAAGGQPIRPATRACPHRAPSPELGTAGRQIPARPALAPWADPGLSLGSLGSGPAASSGRLAGGRHQRPPARPRALRSSCTTHELAPAPFQPRPPQEPRRLLMHISPSSLVLLSSHLITLPLHCSSLSCRVLCVCVHRAHSASASPLAPPRTAVPPSTPTPALTPLPVPSDQRDSLSHRRSHPTADPASPLLLVPPSTVEHRSRVPSSSPPPQTPGTQTTRRAIRGLLGDHSGRPPPSVILRLHSHDQRPPLSSLPSPSQPTTMTATLSTLQTSFSKLTRWLTPSPPSSPPLLHHRLAHDVDADAAVAASGAGGAANYCPNCGTYWPNDEVSIVSPCASNPACVSCLVAVATVHTACASARWQCYPVGP